MALTGAAQALSETSLHNHVITSLSFNFSPHLPGWRFRPTSVYLTLFFLLPWYPPYSGIIFAPISQKLPILRKCDFLRWRVRAGRSPRLPNSLQRCRRFSRNPTVTFSSEHSHTAGFTLTHFLITFSFQRICFQGSRSCSALYCHLTFIPFSLCIPKWTRCFPLAFCFSEVFLSALLNTPSCIPQFVVLYFGHFAFSCFSHALWFCIRTMRRPPHHVYKYVPWWFLVGQLSQPTIAVGH